MLPLELVDPASQCCCRHVLLVRSQLERVSWQAAIATAAHSLDRTAVTLLLGCGQSAVMTWRLQSSLATDPSFCIRPFFVIFDCLISLFVIFVLDVCHFLSAVALI
jgi:hypothetical protein